MHDLAEEYLEHLYGELNERVFDEAIHENGLLAVID